MRRESCFISPGGVGSPAPKDRSLGGDPKRLTLRIPGFLGISSCQRQPPPLLPFPQGLGSHHSGLRPLRTGNMGAGQAPSAPPPGTFRTGGTKDAWVTWKPTLAPLMLGGASLQARSLPSIPGAPVQRLQAPGSDREAHRALGPLRLHPPFAQGGRARLGLQGTEK